MSEQERGALELLGERIDALSRITRPLYALLAGAVILGGWVAILQANTATALDEAKRALEKAESVAKDITDIRESLGEIKGALGIRSKQ